MTSVLLGLTLLAASPTQGFALVVTNNRSLSLERPDLHYADDDGVKYAELFDAALGRDRVILLTDLDAPTRALFPGWVARVRAPTRAELTRAVGDLAALLTAVRAAGDAADVYLVFAGHGDIDRGQGFIELADGRLTARELEREVVDRLPARRIHLVLDSCNSWFMLNPRKPGGKRFATPDGAGGLLETHPNVGAVLSTSAEAVTYEWSELQSGIFSYELRSALRGGADADGDGVVSYTEVAAFVDTANATVKNELYRPRVFARGPGGDGSGALLSPSSPGPSLVVAAAGARRLTVRDAQGVRVADAHKDDGTPLVLRLPPSAAEVTEIVRAGERPVAVARALPPRPGETSLDDLAGGSPPVASRGEPPVFASLFERPFGARSVGASPTSRSSGATLVAARRDVDDLRLHLRSVADVHRDSVLATRLWGAMFFAAAAGGASYRSRPDTDAALWGPAALVASLFALGTALDFTVPRITDRLAARLAPRAAGGDVDAPTFVSVQAQFADEARSMRRQRLIAGSIGVGVGVAFSALVLTDNPRGSRVQSGIMLAESVALALGSLVFATVYKTPVERGWALYERTASESARALGGLDEPGVQAAPVVSAVAGSLIAGLGGSF